MFLKNIFQAKFIKKENRFVWIWILDWKEIKFHIWDTGRLTELLFEWNDILVQKLEEKEWRKYKFRLISARWLLWNFILVNSLLHSKLVEQYFKSKNISYKKEINYWESRIDFLVWNIFIEVKWVSLILRQNNEFIASFPDAPTTRWQKHLQELIKIKQEWFYDAKILFLLTNNVNKFKPNFEIDKKISELFYKFLEIWWKIIFLYVDLRYNWDNIKLNVLEKNKIEILWMK